MGDDYEHRRMICLIFYMGLFYQAFFFHPLFFFMAFDFAIHLHVSLCDLENPRG